jgi:hypothetical protein
MKNHWFPIKIIVERERSSNRAPEIPKSMTFFIEFLMKVNHLTTELHRSQITTFLNRIFKESELSWQQSFRGYKSMLFLIESLMKVSLWETGAPEAQIHHFLNRILNESDPEL